MKAAIGIWNAERALLNLGREEGENNAAMYLEKQGATGKKQKRLKFETPSVVHIKNKSYKWGKGKEIMKSKWGRGQTAIEYLLLVGTAVVFVTIVAYFIKTALNK